MGAGVGRGAAFYRAQGPQPAEPGYSPQRVQPGGFRVARPIRRLALLASVALLAAQPACAPKQRIPLDVGPGPVLVFIDGELVLETPEEVELRADRDHKVFVKREGYTPQLVVLETSELEGRDRLVPARVDVRLQPRLGDREVEVDVEEEPAE